MSVIFASFAFLLILSLGAAGNIGDPEMEDLDLLRRTWYPEDPGETIGMTKRAGIRNFNVVKLRDFRRFLEIARKQQSLMSQQEVQPIEAKGWQILQKVFPNIENRNVQILETPAPVSNYRSARGLSYGRG